ncbi:hypothetical protein BDV97DRAFT_368527 [Delphinella strobiligena]|nr:hypothetical protein BDV97DRAFT_368527 [Delphinella strobiligena]
MPFITWNTETDRKLLLFIIQKADIKIDYAGAAAMMSTGDIKCTENAIQKRMGRLRELAKATSGNLDAPATPKPKRGKRTKAQADDGDDEEDALPKKKARKLAPGKKSKKVAPENEENQQDGDDEDDKTLLNMARESVAGTKGKEIVART